MPWEVLFTDEFAEWWDALTADQQDALVGRVQLLEEHGPNLGRPSVDTIIGSNLPNLKELRASEGGALRVLFIFDPIRQAVLLIGGNKSGQWNEWYRDAIPRAEAIYAQYLAELREEGSIP
ncbi:MAG: type II toxin-antitoxin system RelE/ParE family toxin [Polyangiaceae bacterium]